MAIERAATGAPSPLPFGLPVFFIGKAFLSVQVRIKRCDAMVYDAKTPRHP